MKWLLALLSLSLLNGCAVVNDDHHKNDELPIEGNTQSSELLLTFDDFPCQKEGNPEKQLQINKRILATLCKHNAYAIVFANPGMMERYATRKTQMLKLWANSGHKIGNHTYSHMSLGTTPAFDYKIDIIKGEPILKSILSESKQELVYFRHPYLAYSKDIVKKTEIESFLKARGYKIVGITVDSLDWKYNSMLCRGIGTAKEQYLDHVKELLRTHKEKYCKNIILFHVNNLTSICLDEILSYAKTIGYKLSVPS